ncbi:MAG TPA: osmotically inducible protein OsmC [Elusimicrobia bacterium]|nr:osmotically inducible protein OsmC [Elusimicrobiota bacterium]HBT62130.1 osmotically inducible protein OsmC [Elusimicrobiota bacterium]
MPVHIQAHYIGDDTVELEHGPSGRKMTTDLPVDNGGRGRGFSPTDLLAAGLASCVLTIMAKASVKDGLDLKGASIIVEKEMQTSPRRVARIMGQLSLPPQLSAAQKEKLRTYIRACPVTQSLHPDVKVELAVE